MSRTTIHDRRVSVRAVVVVVLALGAAALAGAAVLLPRLPEPSGAYLLATPAVLVAFVLAAAVSELVSVPLMHGGDKEDLTFFEIVTVAGILVLDPQWAVVAPLVGLLLVQLALRIPLVKAAFNLGSYAVATATSVVVYVVLVDGATPFGFRGIAALVAAMSLFTVINTLLLSAVLYAADGVRPSALVRDVWGLSVLMTAGSIGVGAVGVAVAPVSPWLVPFTVMPAMSLWYAYRSSSSRAEERERNRHLVTLSGLLTEERELADMLDAATESVRAAFGAGRVQILLPSDGDLSTTFPASEGVVPVPITRLPEGWGSAVSVGLELGDGRRGVLLLGDVLDAKRAWAPKQSDEAVITTVAASLSSAVRSAERHAALVEESSKLKAVVENASDGIVVVAAGRRVRLWSPAMARITGIDEHRAALLDGEDVPSAVADIVACAAPGEPVIGRGPSESLARQITVVRPDGDTRDLSIAVVRANSGGEPVAILTVHDVTAQARADRLKSDFVATISHELRTPITPIKGYAQLLLARGDAMTPERRRAAYELIADRADHLGRLVEDLLMASRASGTLGSRLTTSPQQHDVRTMVTTAVESFPSLAPRLVVEEPDGPLAVWCDSARSVQILSNLLSNAQKYAPGDSPIVLRVVPTEVGDTHIAIEVADQGCGLSETDRERVFERFYRVEDSMTMRTSGSGLGLYIARELALAMGGSLTVRSQPGIGSTFTLRLPRTEAAAQTSSPHAPAFARTA
jgi:PAS domain S-box-containing protein